MEKIENYFNFIINDENTFNQVFEKYPELKDLLNSAKQNQNCSCKSQIIQYLNIKLNIPEDYSFFKNLLKNASVDQVLDLEMRPLDGNAGFEIDGEIHPNVNAYLYKVYKVEKREDSWSKFMQDLRTKILFSSFSVVDKGDYLEVYLA
jgi:hypothetical protein